MLFSSPNLITGVIYTSTCVIYNKEQAHSPIGTQAPASPLIGSLTTLPLGHWSMSCRPYLMRKSSHGKSFLSCERKHAGGCVWFRRVRSCQHGLMWSGNVICPGLSSANVILWLILIISNTLTWNNAIWTGVFTSQIERSAPNSITRLVHPSNWNISSNFHHNRLLGSQSLLSTNAWRHINMSN